MEYLDTALLLLGIGISTVFVVLILLILSGNLLIRYVNRFIPEEFPASTQNNHQPTQVQTEAAIRQAIDTASQGKLSVLSIQKL